LSVGQQQRVAVVRALIGNPEIVIADEPTSALDTDNRDRFLQLLFREADHRGSTLIFVSHDPHIANHFSRVLEMSEINHSRPRNAT
jgi:putative ABC transport system ATP-binding protein